MTYTKFINCATLSIFNANKESGIISDSDIVFIEDTNQIWTHDKFYSCPYTREEIDSMISSAGSGSSLTKENIEKVLTGNITSHTHSQYLTSEIDPTVPSWAKSSTKPTYTASEVGALASNGTAVNASKVANSLVLKLNSGTTEGTNLYTFNGSSSKTLDIKAGSNVTLTAGSGQVTISSTNTTYSAGTGLSLSGTTFNHASSITAGTVSDGGATRTLAFGGTFKIPSVTYNATGHITGTSTITLTLPAAPTSVSGNAGTATKLATARNIALTGSVTGNANFDGSGNISIATTTNHTHNYLTSKGNLAPQTGRTQSLGALYTYNTIAGSTSTGAPTTYTSVIGFGNGLGGTVEVAGGWTSGMGLWYRALRDTTDNWYGWRKLLDSTTYTEYTVSKTGTGASGTWGISITGNAATATKLGTASVGATNKPIYLNAGTATACSSTVGSATLPAYMNAGTMTACTASSVFSNLSNSGNNISITVAGQNRTLTPVYSSHAGYADYVGRDRGQNTVTTLASLPITKSTVIANLSAATNISLASNMNVGESITIICTPSASFTQPIPTSGSFISMDGSSLSVTSGKKFEINIYCYNTNVYSISCKVAK